MKIFFNEALRYEPWGGGSKFLSEQTEFLRARGYDVIFSLEKSIDLIFIQANSYWKYDERIEPIFKFKKRNPHVKVLHRINECDKRKNTKRIDKLVIKLNNLADETIFISNWLAEYYIKKGFDKPYNVIYNGCNPNYFFPDINKQLGNKINLVTHHWSNNWMKGFDIYIELDKYLANRQDISFTYIGNYYNNYIPKNTKIKPPLYGLKLGDELRKYDIYLTASRWEPCGMHHIEGARCGLPILYHREGGGINESCQHYGIEYNDISSLLLAINNVKNSYNEYRNRIRYDFLDIQRCCQKYYNVITDMLK